MPTNSPRRSFEADNPGSSFIKRPCRVEIRTIETKSNRLVLGSRNIYNPRILACLSLADRISIPRPVLDSCFLAPYHIDRKSSLPSKLVAWKRWIRYAAVPSPVEDHSWDSYERNGISVYSNVYRRVSFFFLLSLLRIFFFIRFVLSREKKTRIGLRRGEA